MRSARRSRVSKRRQNSDPVAVDNLLAGFHVLSTQISGAFAPEIETRYDVTLAEWRVMLTLASHDGATARDITEIWAMDKMAISRAVRRMEQMGRVRRHKNPEDRRSYSLTLTPTGTRLYKKVLPVANARYRAITEGLSDKELASLRRVVAKLLARTAALSE